MVRSLPVKKLLPQNVGSIINYLQLFTEVAQWGVPSCSQPQLATDNGVRDGRWNWLVAPPTLHRAVPPELHVLHTAMRAGLQITRLLHWTSLHSYNVAYCCRCIHIQTLFLFNQFVRQIDSGKTRIMVMTRRFMYRGA